MGRVIPAWIVLVASGFLCGAACAMNSPNSQSPHCRVIDGGKLPAASGGAAALCEAIEQAVSKRAPGTAFSAEVRVLSSSRLAAALIANGRKLPDQKFASMDHELTKGSFERFARTIAEQVANGQQ
jgi:hypothetical protein